MNPLPLKEIDRILIAAALPMVLIALPFIHVFANNVTNLQLPMEIIFKNFALAIGTLAALSYAVFKLLPTALERAAVLLAIYLIVIGWLQTNFFVGSFGFMTGETPDWSQDAVWQYLQAALLLCIGLLMVFFRDLVLKNALFLVFLLCLSSLVYVPQLLQQSDNIKIKKYALNKEGLYNFSTDKNVVIFILDSAQADVVDSIFKKKPEVAAKFKGFTHFRDALAAFPKTYASIPSILSGDAYDNSQPLHDYLESLYVNNSLPARLTAAGFDSRLSSSSPHAIFAHPLLANNVSDLDGAQRASAEVIAKDSELIANLMLFRLAPHVLKPLVYNQGEFRVSFTRNSLVQPRTICALTDEDRHYSMQRRSYDNLLLDEFSKCAQASLEQPAFRFFHLYAPHAPYQLNEEFQFIGAKPINRHWFTVHTEGVLRVLGDVLQQMEERGILQRSLVIIASDHGEGEYNVGIDYPGDLPERPRNEQKVAPSLVRGGMSLLMVKRPDDEGDLQVSDAPVALTDIPATALDWLGMGNDTEGRSVFSVGENEARSRTHSYYQFSGWNVDYIVPLTPYRVEGFSWFPESWSKAETNLDALISDSFKGQLLTLHRGGTIEDYRHAGWTSAGKVARGLTNEGSSVLLSADGPSLLTVIHSLHRGEDMEVEVWVNDTNRGSWVFGDNDGQRAKSLVIPDSGELNVLFRAKSSNSRKLRFREIRLEPVSNYRYTPDTDILFTDLGDSNRYRTYGWSRTEFWGTSSIGGSSGIFLSLEDASKEMPLQLNMLLSGYVFEEAPEQVVEVLVNGHLLETLSVNKKSKNTYSATIEPSIYRDKNYLDISLRYAAPIRQSLLGVSGDSRLQSVAMEKLSVTEVGLEPRPSSATR